MSSRVHDHTAFSTWIDVLSAQVERQPDAIAYTFLPDGSEPGDTLTYRELELRARAVAAQLQERQLFGERALLLYHSCLDYVVAFLGCLYAGVIAVPAYPPQPSRTKRYFPRLRSIVTDASPQIVLTMSSLADASAAMFADGAVAAPAHWLATDNIGIEFASDWQRSPITAETVAFLQYTSGSTTVPKGVKVSHRNLLQNEELISRAFGHTQDSIVVGWLPLYHDMGLIGNVLQPLYRGIPCVLMPPASFLQNPIRWLAAISKYRATTSGAPNFAYDLCVQKVSSEQREGLDLRNWKVAFSGAEPIRPETLDRFVDAFAPSGFRPETFYPCYGLAEATLMVSGGDAAAAPVVRTFDAGALEQGRVQHASGSGKNVRRLVGCGRNLAGQKIAIVDPETSVECAPRQVGEIWVLGECVALGYWNREDQTAAVFRAHTSAGAGPFLRTGDLGFMSDGELFVTGRRKDLIIVRGRNHYPQDIEFTVEKAHPALRAGCAAAFSVEVEGGEQLVILQEVDRHHRHADLGAVASAIRGAIADQHELTAYAVVLLSPGGLPKTSSGKVQRYVCRQAFTSNSLKALYTDAAAARNTELPAAPEFQLETVLATTAEERQRCVADYLVSQTARVLRMNASRIDHRKPLIALGLDSLMALDLAGSIENACGIKLPVTQLFEAPSVEALADYLSAEIARMGIPRPAGAIDSERRASSWADMPASRQQQNLWLLHQQNPAGSLAYNIVVSVRLRGALDAQVLQQSLDAVIRRHDILRATYSAPEGTLLQIVAPAQQFDLPTTDLSEVSTAGRAAELARLVQSQAQRPFDLGTEAGIRPVLYRLIRDEHVLALVMHHITCDGWSIEVLLQECAAQYRARSVGEPSSFSRAVQYSEVMAPSSELRQVQLQYWRDKLGGDWPRLSLPTDRHRSGAGLRSGQVAIRLSPAVDARLREFCREANATPFMVLLAAFKTLLCRLSGERDVTVGSSVANRNVPGSQPVIGPFTNAIALRTRVDVGADFRRILSAVRQTALAAYEHAEVPFDEVLKELRRIPATGEAPFEAVFLFQNFLTLRWEMNGIAAELEPFDSGLSNFDLTLVFYEEAASLRGSLVYKTDLFDPDTAQQLADGYVALLERAITNPETILTEFHLPPTLELKAESARFREQEISIAIAATFTAEPLEPALNFWMQKLNVPAQISFAPYHQVFQALLDPGGLLVRNRNGINVVLLRFTDWGAGSKSVDGSLVSAETHLQDLVRALSTATADSTVPWLVCLCPSRSDADPRCHDLETQLGLALAPLKSIYLVRLTEVFETYPVSTVFDTDADEIGHIPFSREFYAALATVIARKIHALRVAPYKVVAVDCDQTLWSGVCGEDGARGIAIRPECALLQKFLVTQSHGGMLLCLCSKNNEQDVLEVFEQRCDMQLKLEQITARTINWRPKSENLRALSAELGLGLDSFIFIDDNPAECAQVAAACPDVLVLQLPEDPEARPAFLRHVWAFDRLKTTEEDRRRTILYRQNVEREQFRQETNDLEEFLAGLQLQCEIGKLKTDEAARAAQLTERTNQFNTAPASCTESEILQRLHSGDWVAVKAKDRFGDYGIVGLMLTKLVTDALEIESFLLSCRALGRRIEHRMLAFLGELASQSGRGYVNMRFVRTAKNEPALEFLRGISGAGEARGPELRFRVSAEIARRAVEARSGAAPPTEAAPARPRALARRRVQPQIIVQIANELRDLASIEREIRQQYRPHIAAKVEYVAPATPTERKLAEIWADVLRVPTVGLHDGFFELGGDSIKGTIIISRIRKAFDLELPLRFILERPTVAGLTELVEEELIQRLDGQEIEAALDELSAMTEEQARALLAEESLPINQLGLDK